MKTLFSGNRNEQRDWSSWGLESANSLLIAFYQFTSYENVLIDFKELKELNMEIKLHHSHRCILMLVFLLFIAELDAYKLNVPKVLLPYRISIPVNFTLEITDPSGGCFNW